MRAWVMRFGEVGTRGNTYCTGVAVAVLLVFFYEVSLRSRLKLITLLHHLYHAIIGQTPNNEKSGRRRFESAYSFIAQAANKKQERYYLNFVHPFKGFSTFNSSA